MSTHETPPPTIGVGVVARNPDGRVLLGERINTGESRLWCLPGGRLEADESFEAAGLRELREETGVQVDTASAFCLCLRTGGTSPWLTAGVSVEVPAEAAPAVTEPENFASWSWFPLDRLPGPLFPPTADLLAVLGARGLPRPDIAYSLSPQTSTGGSRFPHPVPEHT
ncbi:nucleotide triphosphate diphosphatase NUDT15 [Allosalinactinospora lopnorensis]|uniref:nucleotide triphosphate diphosphatase NUDT15 n=1 Tax=Allosalinactinospora lopnorensis TaxID=1352348 RepID=UPI000696FC9E|nr:NUDIX domain-containing protein [Allosalinactinospora lopnorensis]